MLGGLVGLVMVPVGIALFAGIGPVGNWQGSNAEARLQWPIVRGSILGSRIHPEWIGGENAQLRDVQTVEFAYQVEDKRYVAHQEWLLGKWWHNPLPLLPRSLSYSDAKAYSAGKAVTVYYNPTDPAEAYVRPSELGPWELFAVVGGGILVVLGILVLVGTFFLSGPVKIARQCWEKAGLFRKALGRGSALADAKYDRAGRLEDEAGKALTDACKRRHGSDFRESVLQ